MISVVMISLENMIVNDTIKYMFHIWVHTGLVFLRPCSTIKITMYFFRNCRKYAMLNNAFYTYYVPNFIVYYFFRFNLNV